MERIRWQVLCKFAALPTNDDVKKMCDSDYLYCYIHMLLDSEDGPCDSIEIGFNTEYDFKNYIEKGEKK